MSGSVDRSPLRFAEEVQDQFSFLLLLGYECVEANSTLVRFESSRIVIRVYHGRRSYEIGLDLCLKRNRKDIYFLEQLLNDIDDSERKTYGCYATHSREGVKTGVHKLAKIFRRCINTGILEDPDLFRRLKKQSEQAAADYALEVQLHHARAAAQIAWAKKDFAQVVRVFKPFKKHLTATEIKRLLYCVKQIS